VGSVPSQSLDNQKLHSQEEAFKERRGDLPASQEKEAKRKKEELPGVRLISSRTYRGLFGAINFNLSRNRKK